MDAELRKHCQTRKAAMVAERDLFVPDWQQVADYINPYAGRFLRTRTVGTQKLPSRSKIIDNAATRALRTMDAGFMGGHTSKSRPWFRLSTSDAALNDRQDVRAWLDDVAQIIRDVLAKSNFYTALPKFYNSRHMFGVAAMACVEDTRDVVRFYVRSIGTYAIALDARGMVDSFWYEFERSARQIKEMFGEQSLPQAVISALSTKPDTKFMVQALIEPNPDAKPGIQGARHRPFRIVYWMDGQDNENRGCLEMGGDYENPMLVSRWLVEGMDCYGTSPCLDSLGDIKQLQYLEGRKLKLLDMSVEPTLALPDSMRNKGATLNPGGLLYVTPSQTQQRVEPVYTPDPRALVAVQNELQTVGARIESALYADLFRMLDFLDDRQRTAYEIGVRQEEKVAQLGPALESLTDEVLDPVIFRVYSILLRSNRLPKPPPALDRQPVNVEYTSMLAQAQKAAGLSTIERTIGFVGQLAAMTGSPKVWNKIDLNQAIDEFNMGAGGPARIVRSDEDVAEIESAQAQQEQMQQMAALSPALKDSAEAMTKIAGTKPVRGSMLENLAGNMAGMV